MTAVAAQGRTQQPDRRQRFPFDRRRGSSASALQRDAAVVRKFALMAVLAWCVLSMLSLYLQMQGEAGQVLEVALTDARARLNAESALRGWVAAHGGIYVVPDERTPPNPYLIHLPSRDVTTTDGKRLTLISTSYLTRLVSEFDRNKYDSGLRISGPKPLNPGNVPQEWEAAAYAAFAGGAAEHTWLTSGSDPQYLTVARPLKAGKECLKCHTDPALKEGDLLGVLSARIDMTSYRELTHHTRVAAMTSHGFTWLVGLIGIAIAFRINLARMRERITAQEVLIESQNLFQTIADNASDWIFWREPGGRFRYVSPACRTISGYEPEDFYANPDLFVDIVHPEDREAFRRHVAASDGGLESGPVEFRILTRTGQVRYVSHSCRPIHDEVGCFVGISGANHDITPLRENQQILVNQSRHAAMGEMINNIAHQWRQPISAVGLILQNLQYDYEEGRLESKNLNDYVKRGRELIGRMSTTIDDFRNFFRPDRDPVEFAVEASVRDAVEMLEDSFRAHGIEISWDMAGRHRILGYPNELAQVMLNLLINAKDAILERGVADGRISIVMSGGKELTITVSDNGGGIPAELVGRIFDPYFTTKATGTGIGLYMCLMIVGHMGGTMAARNVEGGAAFDVKLPIARGTAGGDDVPAA